ncbi:hypothetical protein SKAU_G00247160 [Synaphobranchus kaupii]|uniref:U1-type domain-containing protein n=1 Tax=Synaphobranchus kaupii TaxID=118154 RepID=A0A9Q1F297_SYNKA|nr:hypothetical protein SKAU_G00247160 [Synaphobranchus kaupii]
MKRPLSPTHLLENGVMCAPFGSYVEGEEPGTGHAHSHQEKKMLPFSLCEVCNIQLNSAAQAQVHYNGKSHLKRVKQLSNGEVPMATGPATLSTISEKWGSCANGSEDSLINRLRVGRTAWQTAETSAEFEETP